MRRMLLVAGALAVVLAVPVSADDKDSSKLVGTWKVTAMEKDGKAAASADAKGKEVKITRDAITCTKDGKTDMACTYTLDTSSKPWTITMKCTSGELKGKTLKGIVKLEGDTLKVCHSKPDKDAPTSFKTKDDQCCMTLEKEKR